ncbi:MAG: hypothetical protein KAH20_10385 [Methylococcales bacterium]|nr:hypothetical protein [Methylococcales bacterium]
MKQQISQPILVIIFTLGLFFVSQSPVGAGPVLVSQPPVGGGPGTLAQTPLFASASVQPNIFFMLDDSGSMFSTITVPNSINQRWAAFYYWNTPVLGFEEHWRTWCLGSNLLAYNSSVNYLPWAANMPGTTTPYPDQILTSTWAEPTTKGVGFVDINPGLTTNFDTGTVDLSNAPIIEWVDDNNDGVVNELDCPTSDNLRVTRARSLSAAEKTNFANWFTYYRDRDRTATAAVLQVVSESSDRIGMATLFNNSMEAGGSVGKPIEDMTIESKKNALLADIANTRPGGFTPLRSRLNWVGEYFESLGGGDVAPPGLNIGAVPSPILSAAEGGQCQQNFAILMTDGGWNDNTFTGVGHQDQNTANEFIFNAHQDNIPNTLADVAMKWYKTNLDTSLGGELIKEEGTDAENLDENTHPHLVTYTVAFGLPNSLAAPTDRNNAFAWPPAAGGDPNNFSEAQKLLDLQHAAYNGRGKFLSADNPGELLQALRNILHEAGARKGSSTAVSFNTSALLAGSQLYFANFDSNGWKGNVRAFSINENTGVISPNAIWDAAEQLDSLDSVGISARVIYTLGEPTAAINDGVLFDWSVNVPHPADNILTDFKENPNETTEASPFTKSSFRLDYIRGDTSQDGGDEIRNRKSRLGDIIHSATHYVGKPVSNWPNEGFFGVPGKRYSTYQANKQNRKGVVYVGANDGLLHGFAAKNSSGITAGDEVFAYLPSATASALDKTGLHYFSEPSYQHRYYVDGSPKSADVYIKIQTGENRDWRTILVGGLGGGGKGVYALDVSQPDDFTNTVDHAKQNVLWEFTNLDDDHLGFSFSEPQVTMMNNGKWAVIFGNGYNATATHTAELFILFIEEGLDGEWTLNDDYIRIDTKAGDSTHKNGLSTPTLVDLDGNGSTDRIYAGDLLGHMWAFDVSSTTSSNWDIPFGNSTTPVALFTSASAQPITSQPITVKPEPHWIADVSGGANAAAPNMMVYFGTGQYIANGDATNTDEQSFYGIWDGGVAVTPSKLVEQTFVNTGALIDESGSEIKARVLSENTLDLPESPVGAAAAAKLGWVINLTVETSERVIVKAFTHNGLIYFNTMTPSGTACDPGGESWLMAVDMKTGANPVSPAFDIFNAAGVLFDDDDKVTDSSGDKHNAAGIKFELGIASATSVITNDAGQSFGLTSGTDAREGADPGSNNPNDSIEVFRLPPSPSEIKGLRRSWLQLFSN